ncbi:MAG: ABC transporter ATP-binding protein, partial [Myxococcales bacterium]|nr:ABC transporter ATP-binding protein [Myxococcales bacterium]
MIRTESLTKYFGNRCVVREVSIKITARQIVGFLGLNGAGKTTTLRLLAGLLSPSSGRVFIDDQDITKPDGFHVRANIGFLPDRPPVYDEMLVREYLYFAARLRHHPGDNQRINEVLEVTGLSHFADRCIGHLSHGYRQRVGIAQAIVHEPTLVILDEPTSGLDPQQIVDMRRLIRSLTEAHTVLLSSHNLTEIEQCCDEILLLHEGKLEAQGTPSELTKRFDDQQRINLVVIGKPVDIHTAVTSMTTAGLVSEAQFTELSDSEGLHLNLTTSAAPEVIAHKFFSAGF